MSQPYSDEPVTFYEAVLRLLVLLGVLVALLGFWAVVIVVGKWVIGW